MKHKQQGREIRTSFKMRGLGALVGWLLRLYAVTLRIKVVDHCGLTDRGKHEKPLLWCLWHNRIAGTLMARRRVFGWRKGAVLTSASHDGAGLAAVAKVMGGASPQCSSHRCSSGASGAF